MIEIDEMICIDSSGDWERPSVFQAIFGVAFKITYLWSGCNVDLRMSPCIS
jgi:hypothetical protein